MTKTATSVPFERTYWVIPGKLAAGCYPGDLDPGEAERKLRGLIQAGIRYVINLMEETELNWYGNIFISYENDLKRYAAHMGIDLVCVRRPIEDLSIPTHEEMEAILNEIDLAISNNRPVYVHCLGGIGRTGTVVGCYLMRHGYAKSDTILDVIQQLRMGAPEYHRPSPEAPLQRRMVTYWKKGE